MDQSDDFRVIEIPSSSEEESANPDEIVQPLIRPEVTTENLQDIKLDELSLCPICFDNWSSNGPHRIVSLECGHLFGRSCIETWLTPAFVGESKRCPKCNAPASKKKIRPIYQTMIVSVDTARLESLESDLKNTRALYEAEQNTNKKLRIQLQTSRAETLHAVKKAAHLQQLLDTVQPDSMSPILSGVRNWETLPSIQLSPPGAYRYLTPSPDFDKLFVTRIHQRTSSIVAHSLHSSLTMDLGPLHTSAIRSLVHSCHHPHYLLTASMDCTAALFNTHSKATMVKFQAQGQAWSAQFHSTNPNLVYVGQQRHMIQVFDLRQPGFAVEALTHPGPGIGPAVHSLVHVADTLISASFLSVVQWDSTAHPEPLAEKDCFAVEAAPSRAPAVALAFRGPDCTTYAMKHLGNPTGQGTMCTVPVPSSLMFRFALWESQDVFSNATDESHSVWNLAAPNQKTHAVDIFRCQDGSVGPLAYSLPSESTTPLLDVKCTWPSERTLLVALNEPGELFLFQHKSQ